MNFAHSPMAIDYIVHNAHNRSRRYYNVILHVSNTDVRKVNNASFQHQLL